MTTILFIFAILTAPRDVIVCDLWTAYLTQEAFDAACPITALSPYRLDVYPLDMSERVCTRSASSLPRVLEDCNLEGPLDLYVLRIVKPRQSDLICFYESASDTPPTPEQVREQCPEAREFVVEYAGTRRVEELPKFSCPAREIPTGHGLYEQPFDTHGLVTRDELPLLAGQLIWLRVVPVISCNGAAGVTPERVATPCGYLSAHDDVIHWQNQFNAAILEAAVEWRVPARLLKRMMMIESQFWIFHERGEAGEIGIMQITDNGLDTLLRWDRAIDPDYLKRTEEQRAWSRNITRQLLTCPNCSLQEAINHTKQITPFFARLLAAFHCRAVTLNPTLTGADEWRQTVVDYNGSTQYLERIEP